VVSQGQGQLRKEAQPTWVIPQSPHYSCSCQDRRFLDLGSWVQNSLVFTGRKKKKSFPGEPLIAGPCLAGYGNTAFVFILPCCWPSLQPECCCQSLLVIGPASPASGPSSFFYEDNPTLGSPKTPILGLGEGRVILELRGCQQITRDSQLLSPNP